MNHNAKGKGLIFGEKAKKVTMSLYSWEKPLVKLYLKTIREQRKLEIKSKIF